jgi:two-component system alkaline phosphatase synthesis response regulator PhoP
MTASVLVVEDEAELRIVLEDNLQYEGYRVISAATGEQALAIAQDEHPSLVLLDVMLPGMSGYEVCRKLRTNGVDVPIIMITARNAELDRIAGLELGADDYVGKPFSVRELMARVRAQLRRHLPQLNPDEFKFGDVIVDLKRRTATKGSGRLELSSREIDLLLYFVAHRGEVVSRERLQRDVWEGAEAMLSRTVDNFVAKLRRKIEPDHNQPRYIVTVHGIGYRFVG